jgi:small-conductance mechanosensitive channel
MTMARVIVALLFAPMLVLGEQSLVYALVTPLCARQAGGWLHAVALGVAVLIAVLTAMAHAEARRLQQQPLPPDTDRHGPNRLFLARVATGTGLLSLVALVALWAPLWVLSPCQS